VNNQGSKEQGPIRRQSSRALVFLLVVAAFSRPVSSLRAASQPVAVLDFSVSGDQQASWSWASGGMADLLQIEVERIGLVTLDRDFIRAVLREQRLLADPSNTTDQFKLGSLLHARYLITGKVTPLTSARIRLEVSAFSVEEIENIVTAMGEGAYPGELTDVIRSVATTLANRLPASRSQRPKTPVASAAPKPEALIMFYRGLDACTHGRPEVGVAWFMNSAELDHDYTAPLLWEMKAYNLAGFTNHASIREAEIASTLKRPALATPASEPRAAEAKPIFAVLNATVTGCAGADSSQLAASATAELKNEILRTGEARLFAFENIGEAMTEQDLKLSSLFASEGAPRYGRWLMSDALLSCSITVQATGRVAISVSLIDPLSGAELLREERAGELGKLSALTAAAARALVNAWPNRKSAPRLGAALEPTVAPLRDEDLGNMRPAFRALALALGALRRDPGNGELHGAVADAFVGTGRLRQAGDEINRRLDALDIHAPKADLNYFGVHRWATFNVGVAMAYADQKRLARLIDELLAVYPRSLAAGCMSYNLALNEWRAAHWGDAVERASRAREVLDAFVEVSESERTILTGAYFLEGASLVKLGRLDEAEAVLRKGRALLKKYKMRGFCLPATPFLWDYQGPARVAGYGGDRPEIASRTEEQLDLIAKMRTPALVDYEAKARALYQAETHPVGRNQNWLRCAEQIVGVLEQMPLENKAQFAAIMGMVHSALSMARSDANSNGRNIKDRLFSLLLRKHGCVSLASAESFGKTNLLGLAGEINATFCSAGWCNEVPLALAPLFEPPYPPDFGFSILLMMNIPSERLLEKMNRLGARCSGAPTNVPAPLWIKLAEQRTAESHYRGALDAFGHALAQGASLKDCAGLSATLIEATLHDHSSASDQQIRGLCARAGLPAFEPVWYEWFNHGRKYQTARAWEKAIICYERALDFLKDPEKSGRYKLEPQESSTRVALRSGNSLAEVDLLWSELLDSRLQSATFYLAQCLIEAGRPDEAAPLLRKMAVRIGGDTLPLIEEATWNSSRYQEVHLGVRAAELLKALHAEKGEEESVAGKEHARK
jgi:tetratricopeptide (TPR) repeat protein